VQRCHSSREPNRRSVLRVICRRDGEWRPADADIEALDLTDWDSTDLIEFAAGRDTTGLVTDPE
jgi:hypothetical protein